MAKITNAFDSYEAKGQREDLSDVIWDIWIVTGWTAGTSYQVRLETISIQDCESANSSSKVQRLEGEQHKR